jgi:hypothetical protein
MTGFWRELKRANKERIRQDNARAREAKRLDKIQQAKNKLAETLARNGEGAMPSSSRIRVKEGSGSPMGSENSRSIRKRLVRSRVEHPTEKTLPIGSKGQKKQRGSMGKLSIPSTVKPSSAIELPKEEERKIPRPKKESKRKEEEEANRLRYAASGKETGTYSVSGEDYRKQQAVEAAAKRKKIKQPSSGGGAPTISEEIGKKERSAFCENCGNTLKPTAKFCGSCGTRIA